MKLNGSPAVSIYPPKLKVAHSKPKPHSGQQSHLRLRGVIAETEPSISRPQASASRDSMYAEYAAATAAAAAAASSQPSPMQSMPSMQSTAPLPFQPLHSMPLGPLAMPQGPLSALLNPPSGTPTAQQLMQFSQAWTLWQSIIAPSQQSQGAGQGPTRQPSLAQLAHLTQLQQPLLMPMQYQLSQGGKIFFGMP